MTIGRFPVWSSFLDSFPTHLVFVLLQQQGNEEEEGKEAMSTHLMSKGQTKVREIPLRFMQLACAQWSVSKQGREGAFLLDESRKPWEGKEKWSPLGYRKSVRTNHRPVQTAQALPFPLTYHLGRLYQSHSSLGVVQHQLMTGIFVQSEAICRPIPFVWLIQRPGGNSRDQFFSLFKLFFFAKWETNRVVTSL